MMDQQLPKPESRNMDACLRRLKQELVGSGIYHFLIAGKHERMLLYFINAQINNLRGFFFCFSATEKKTA